MNDEELVKVMKSSGFWDNDKSNIKIMVNDLIDRFEKLNKAFDDISNALTEELKKHE
jgi:endonuclease III-like uncharacterized protein